MDLERIFFEDNPEFISKIGDRIETEMKKNGLNFTNCPDEFLMNIADGVGKTVTILLFEHLKKRRDLPKNE